MREKTFRRPNVKEIFKLNGINVPETIDKDVLFDLVYSQVFVPSGNSYSSAVKRVENIEFGQLVLFSDGFRVSKSDSDRGMKSLERLAKIDSREVLRSVSGLENVPGTLTNEFAETYQIWPYTLAVDAMKSQDIENPPWGFYWVGGDGRARSTTWIRAVAGAEMRSMKQKKDFNGRVLDKTHYGSNLRVEVGSRNEEGKKYEFTISRLPIHLKDDVHQYSGWINLSHNSSDPDASYRGVEHDQRKFEPIFWSASTIYGFYEAMTFVRSVGGKAQVRINPFPIPRDERMMSFIDDLRLSSLMMHEERSGRIILSSLNKTEIDQIIGARTVLRGYENCWTHFGKKDFSFLYRPK